MSDHPTRRSVVKGVLATGAAGLTVPLAGRTSRAAPPPQGKALKSVTFHRYVFASDPRAKSGGFQVMPG